MSCSDPIADMLTAIRNGQLANKQAITIPHSQVKTGICRVLHSEGYINGFDVLETKPGRSLQIRLKYGPSGELVITHLTRISTPGRRVYKSRSELKPIIRGMGLAIVSTSHGILSDRDCRKQNLGGEVICEVK